MAVRHAVLGLLIQRQSYPYELSVLFKERMGPVWELNRGQIYSVVERLEKDGLIERVDKRPSARGPRWIYRPTASGEEEFSSWFLRRSDKLRPLRDELIVKLALSSPKHVDHLLQVVARRERLCIGRISDYSELEGMFADLEETGGWEYIWPGLILKSAAGQLHAELAWLREVRARLEQFAFQTGDGEQGLDNGRGQSRREIAGRRNDAC